MVRVLTFESLEDRRLLAADITYSGSSGCILIEGSTGNDDVKVEVKKDLVVVSAKFDGQKAAATFDVAQVEKILFRGREGDDKFENKTSIHCSL